MVQPVRTSPPYCYSIGLNRRELPEIMVAGFDTKVGRHLIDKTAELMESGIVLTDWSTSCDIFAGHLVRFRELHSEDIKQHCVMLPDQFSQDQQYRILQLFIPDERQLFPWNRQCSSTFKKQCFLNMMYRTPPIS
jgi:hypothetical protein